VTEKKRNVFEEPVEIDVGSDAAAPAEGADAGTGPDELAALEEELAKHREAMLRMQAESENLRKRLVRDQERSRKFALEGIMKELLQVRD
jgi:molecular chaperone GrpE